MGGFYAFVCGFIWVFHGVLLQSRAEIGRSRVQQPTGEQSHNLACVDYRNRLFSSQDRSTFNPKYLSYPLNSCRSLIPAGGGHFPMKSRFFILARRMA